MAADKIAYWKNDGTTTASDGSFTKFPNASHFGWTRDGFTFKNWNSQSDGGGTSYEAEEYVPADPPMNLYAQWEANGGDGFKKLINLSLLNRFLENLNTLLESIQAAIEAKIPAKYAASESAGGPATVANGIHYAQVDGSSTATVFTASIDGITEYYDGLTVLLKNGVITSASGFTVNINGLGAKPVYSNMSAATRETTIFNVGYTLMLIYDSTRVTGGCWINYRGYYSDANSVGYQLRTDSTVLKTLDPSRYYRLMFTSADGTHWVPANTAKDNSATSKKIVNQRPIDPFGRIIYFGYTTNLSAESDVPDNYCWDQHTVTLGYSFNTSGTALELTTKTPVYIKCAPQSNGSAIIDSTTPYVQALPSTDDGMIYIYLGVAYNATSIELVSFHPVYYYKDGAIRIWTNPILSSSEADPAAFLITFTGNSNLSSDKTFAQIKQAYVDGKILIARYDKYIYQLKRIDGNNIRFYFGRQALSDRTVTDEWIEIEESHASRFAINQDIPQPDTTYHFLLQEDSGRYYIVCDDLDEYGSPIVEPSSFVTLFKGNPYFNAVCVTPSNDDFAPGYFDCRIWNFSGIHVIPIQGDDGNNHYISRIIFARISVDDTGNTVTQSLYVDYDIENDEGSTWYDLEANVNW